MQLTFDQIRAITVGAVDFDETKDYLQPYRFTKAQREFTAYADRYYYRGMASPPFPKRSSVTWWHIPPIWQSRTARPPLRLPCGIF